MKPEEISSSAEIENEISTLIEELLADEQRLEELTGGEIDTFAGRDGRTFLLRRAQDQLRHNDAERQVAILNALPANIALIDAQGIIVSINDGWRKSSNVNVWHGPGHSIGKNYLEICDRASGSYASDALQVAVGVRSVLSGAQRSFSLEYPLPSPAGLQWFLLTATPLFDDRQKGVVIAHLDITERKLSETAVTKSELKFRTLFEYAPDGILIADPSGYYLDANTSICGMLGYSHEELVGLHTSDIVTPSSVSQWSPDSTKKNEHRNQVWEFRRKNKSLFAGDVLITLMSDGNLMAMIRDITDQKQLEEQLRQAQKMEAVGVLAGGIAHDFNNLLTAINGYSDLTLKKMATDDPFRKNIVEVKNAGSRAAELTTQLLAFSRKQVLKSAIINLNSVITNIENMLSRIIRESIDLRVVLEPKLGNVRADPGQIEQVIVNLAINARDAMPEGGTLTIETENIYLDDVYVSQHIGVSPGEYVIMMVTDTGEGMDEAQQSHIFEPFFTTKEVGKGTGLGLATVFGIVKQSSGDILVSSEVGRGTTFRVYLPCIDEAVQKPIWGGDRKPTYSGTQTILLVEDEEIVRNLVREILRENGYNVLAAAGGHAALTILDTHIEPIHLLLTDVIMPRMGGSELKARVVKRLPDIKVIFMSGYTNDSIGDLGISGEDTAFIEKPFTPDALAQMVHEVLGN